MTAVNVVAGQQVKTGEVLATLGSAELQSAVTSAQATVAVRRGDVVATTRPPGRPPRRCGRAVEPGHRPGGLTTGAADMAGAQLVAGFDGTIASVGLTVGEELG